MFRLGTLEFQLVFPGRKIVARKNNNGKNPECNQYSGANQTDCFFVFNPAVNHPDNSCENKPLWHCVNKRITHRSEINVNKVGILVGLWK